MIYTHGPKRAHLNKRDSVETHDVGDFPERKSSGDGAR